MHRGALVVGLGMRRSSGIKAGWGGVLTARDPFQLPRCAARGTLVIGYRGSTGFANSQP